MIVEAFVQGVIYATTAIATLRAGSRAIYAYNHENEIGVMDGPLILSPQDIAKLREQGSMEGEVSPLWKSVHGFTEAVRLLHDEAQFTDDVVTGNWKKEEETNSYYSMASPHKPFEEIRVEKKQESDVNKTESRSESVVEETSLVVATKPKEIDELNSRSIFSPLYDYISTRTQFMVESSQAISKLCWELLKYHPLFGTSDRFSATYDDDDDLISDGDDGDLHEDDLDLDLFYSKIIEMPQAADFDDLMNADDDSENESDRVACIKAYAPKTFSKLRTRFGINEEQFLTSLTRSGPNVSFQSNSKGAARVGGFFFFSRDGAYMVKTIKV